MTSLAFVQSYTSRLFPTPTKPPAEPALHLRRAPLPSQIRTIGTRKYSAIASTATKDRHGDVIVQEGWDLRAYRKNPVVLLSHDYQALPVGKASRVAVERGQLVIDFELAKTAVASEVAGLIAERFLNAVSVGFRSIESEAMREGYGRRHLKAELLEVSLVSVPSNPQALVQAPMLGKRFDPVRQPRLAARARSLELARLRA